MNDFGNKIYELRRSKGMTQDSLAEALGVTAQAVSKWERGESMPDVSLLPKLAEIFEASIDSLFGVEKKPLVEYVPEKQRDFNKMILHIICTDDGDKININLPLSLIKAAIEIGVTMDSVQVGGADLSKIDFSAIIKLIENGAVGRLVDIESSDGSTVVIEVI